MIVSQKPFILSLLLVLIAQASAQSSIHEFCGNVNVNHTDSGDFQAVLDQFLSAISTSSDGFSNSSCFQNIFGVYSIGLCRGDLDPLTLPKLPQSV
ncbi:hypothetical protein PanWU01x14_301460 [Parasponia andersonii]|uniref:Gnk2-like domain containing protein n=1 Tax=Parasponia andersonii TaxID=3476 RepID=A0A2P5ATN3_PARAD|nr:hypothetical protein PanWU01x14_301460 [Parasponia andersonii]